MIERAPLRVHEHEVEIEASASAVWRALTDAREISNWFGWDAVESSDTAFKEEYFTAARQEPERYLLVGDRSARFTEFTLEVRGEGCVVRLVHSGSPEASEWDGIYDPENSGWRGYLLTLQFYLERHAGLPKRGFHFGTLSGLSREDAFAKLVGPDGLDHSNRLGSLGVGARFSAVTASGADLTGSVRARSTGTQITVVVESLNDAWLNIWAAPVTLGPSEARKADGSRGSPGGSPPASSPGLMLVTWGLDDAFCDGLHASWRNWLEALFPPDA